MELQDFVHQIDNYSHLTPIGKKAVDIYCLELTDQINKKDIKESTCPHCGGTSCVLCKDGLINSIDQINNALGYYIEKILLAKFERKSDIDCIFHPLVVKTSLSKDRYDMFFKELLGLEYTAYVAKIKYGNTTRDARNDYVLNNLMTLDYDNSLEVSLCDRFLTYLLEEKKDLTAEEEKWLIKYISMKKAHKMNAKIDITILTIQKFIKQEKISLLKPLSLIKVGKLFTHLGSETMALKKGKAIYRIMVNPLGIYLRDTTQKKEDIVAKMFETSYHEMRHVYQNRMIEENKMPNLDVLFWAREFTIHEEYEEYYDTNYSAMTIERDARIASKEQTLKSLKKYSSKIYALKKAELLEEIELDKSVKDLSTHRFLGIKETRDNMTRRMVDEILKENPNYIEKYPALKREYNVDGTRKNVIQLLIDEKEFRDEMKSYQDELYREQTTDKEFKIIQDLLSKTLNDGLKCFDELIYLSLEKKNNQYITNICNQLYIEDMKRIERAVSHRINDTIVKKIELLELYRNGQMKEKQWLFIDTSISSEYAEELNIQTQLLGQIQHRENIIKTSVPLKTR